MNELQDLGKTLRARRREGGLTQQALADAAGVPRRTYQRLEAGHPGTRIDVLILALRALGLRIVLTPRQRPTLDELGAIYGNEDENEPAAG
jgi:transcriptional regulator with XRE-family HTH domain